MDDAGKSLMLQFPNASWIKDLSFDQTVYLYNQTTISDESLSEIKAAFRKYNLNVGYRGDEYWFERVSQVRNNTVAMPPKYILVNGLPQLQDAPKNQSHLSVPTPAPPIGK